MRECTLQFLEVVDKALTSKEEPERHLVRHCQGIEPAVSGLFLSLPSFQGRAITVEAVVAVTTIVVADA